MADPIETTLSAMIKALSGVVADALESSDPGAQEQLKLCIEYLEFFEQRLHLMTARNRREFELTLDYCVSLCELPIEEVSRSTASELRQAVEEMLARDGWSPADDRAFRDATERLNGLASNIVRLATAAAPELRDRVNLVIVEGAQSVIELERAWYLPLGFDHHPEELPELAAVLEARSVVVQG